MGAEPIDLFARSRRRSVGWRRLWGSSGPEAGVLLMVNRRRWPRTPAAPLPVCANPRPVPQSLTTKNPRRLGGSRSRLWISTSKKLERQLAILMSWRRASAISHIRAIGMRRFPVSQDFAVVRGTPRRSASVLLSRPRQSSRVYAAIVSHCKDMAARSGWDVVPIIAREIRYSRPKFRSTVFASPYCVLTGLIASPTS